jgi:hypothetical protein
VCIVLTLASTGLAALPGIFGPGLRGLHSAAAEGARVGRIPQLKKCALIRARGMKDQMIKAQVDVMTRELDVYVRIGGDAAIDTSALQPDPGPRDPYFG